MEVACPKCRAPLPELWRGSRPLPWAQTSPALLPVLLLRSARKPVQLQLLATTTPHLMTTFPAEAIREALHLAEFQLLLAMIPCSIETRLGPRCLVGRPSVAWAPRAPCQLQTPWAVTRCLMGMSL